MTDEIALYQGYFHFFTCPFGRWSRRLHPEPTRRPDATLVPLANETIVTSPSGQPTPIIVDNATSAPGEATLVVPPLGNETLVPAVGDTPVPQNGGDSPRPLFSNRPFFPPRQPSGYRAAYCHTHLRHRAKWSDDERHLQQSIHRQAGRMVPAHRGELWSHSRGTTSPIPGLNPNLLRPGQVLNIPGGGLAGGGSPPHLLIRAPNRPRP